MHPEEEEEEVDLEAPSTPKSQLFSSPFTTPYTARQIDIDWRYLEAAAEELFKSQPQSEEKRRFEYQFDRMMHGNIAMTVEYEEAVHRLQRVEKAQKEAQDRANTRNHYLQKGGVLQVSHARTMTAAKEKKELEKAQHAVDRVKRAVEKEAAEEEKARKKKKEELKRGGIRLQFDIIFI